jgi:hypothetical protein
MERKDREIWGGKWTGTGPDGQRKGEGTGLSLGLTCSLTRLVGRGKGTWQTRQVDLGLFLLFFCSGVFFLYMIFFFCLAWYLLWKKAQESNKCISLSFHDWKIG